MAQAWQDTGTRGPRDGGGGGWKSGSLPTNISVHTQNSPKQQLLRPLESKVRLKKKHFAKNRTRLETSVEELLLLWKNIPVSDCV